MSSGGVWGGGGCLLIRFQADKTQLIIAICGPGKEFFAQPAKNDDRQCACNKGQQVHMLFVMFRQKVMK